jgi:hypothetical protein
VAVREVYARATAACPPLAGAADQQQRFEQRLRVLCRPYLLDGTAPQGVLCRRIEKHLSELFVFVADPQVPPTNNAAERSLRPVAIARKISSGTRSVGGSTIEMTLAWLVGT